MDGLTLAEKIRQRYPSMKIVIFSGYDDFDYAKRAIKLNVTEYILKPVNVEELTAILRTTSGSKASIFSNASSPILRVPDNGKSNRLPVDLADNALTHFLLVIHKDNSV